MITMPHGYCLGRLTASEAKAIVASEGLHDLSRVRGRACYRQPVQAGEIALRSQLGLQDYDGVVVVRIEHGQPDWRMKFRVGQRAWKVTVRPEITGTLRPKSCGGDVEAVKVFSCVLQEDL